jgi:hypothetical protein
MEVKLGLFARATASLFVFVVVVAGTAILFFPPVIICEFPSLSEIEKIKEKKAGPEGPANLTGRLSKWRVKRQKVSSDISIKNRLRLKSH